MEERASNRIVVSVLLAPIGPDVRLDGVSLQLQGRQGEALSARMVLPIAGALTQPMLSTLELRPTIEELPAGARVVGTVWQGNDQREASLPTDPSTAFERHVRARCRVQPEDPEDAPELVMLPAAQRARLTAIYPWISEPRVSRSSGELAVVENEDDIGVDEVMDELGIDAESAEWLKDLLAEE